MGTGAPLPRRLERARELGFQEFTQLGCRLELRNGIQSLNAEVNAFERLQIGTPLGGTSVDKVCNHGRMRGLQSLGLNQLPQAMLRQMKKVIELIRVSTEAQASTDRPQFLPNGL